MSKAPLPPLPPESAKIKVGKYVHYMGGNYRSIGVGRHSESLEVGVLYKSVEDGSLWFRPLNKWLEPVKDQPEVERFKYQPRPRSKRKCKACNGTGGRGMTEPLDFGGQRNFWQRCKLCDGTGKR